MIPPGPTPEDLLRETDRLRPLVRMLVRDEATGDDVLQEARLVALRRPPGPGWTLAAWLKGVVRHVASKIGRSENRRARHEHAAARSEGQPGAAEEMERLDTLARVLDAVRGLAEPYRSALVLRYVEGLGLAQIAERLGVPRETVKTRLRRGLEILRERLDAAHGGDRRAWLPMLVPFAARGARWAATGSAAAITWSVIVAMKTYVAVAAAAAVVLLGTVTWVHSSRTKPGRTATPEVTASADPRGDVTRPGDPTPAGVRAVPFPGASESPAGPTGDDGPLLEVVAADTGAPLPAAVVHVWDPDATGISKARPPRTPFEKPDYEQEYATYGTEFIADDLGHVRLPQFRKPVSVSARQGERWGRGWFRPTDPVPYRVRLEIDKTLRIQVVDSAGQPKAGVPVLVQVLIGPGSTSDFYRGVTSGADGLYEARHVQIHSWRGNRAMAALGWTLPGTPRVDIDVEKLPTEPVRLVLPGTGQVIVHVVDEDGRPFSGESFVGLGLHDRPSASARFEYDWFKEQQWIELKDGRVAFPCVGLGLDLAVQVHVMDGLRTRSRVRFAGPTRPGEDVQVSLTVGKPHPALVGRAMGEDGHPLARKRMWVAVAEPADRLFPWQEQAEVTTDASARFRLPLANPKWRLDGNVLRFTTRYGGAMPHDEPELIASREAPAAARDKTETDLGDIVLRPAPLLAAGTAVDETGRPIHDAHVRLQFIAHRYGKEDWDTDSRFDVRTRADGSFEMYGPWPDAPLRLSAAVDGHHLPSPVPLVPGTADVRVVLAATGSLEGSLRLPPDVPPAAVRIYLNGAIFSWELKPWRHSEVATIDADGSFRIPTLRPGRGSFEIVMAASEGFGSFRDRVAVIEGLEIRPGEVCRDPRLQRIDLRDKVRAVAVSVVDGDGRPVAEAGVQTHLQSPGAEGFWRTVRTGAGGTAKVVLGRTPARLRVAKDGFQSRDVPVPEHEVRVVLDPGIKLRVTVTGLERPAGDGWSFHLDLARKIEGANPSPDSSGFSWMGIAGSVIPESDIVELMVPGPGDCRVGVRLGSAAKPGSFWGVASERLQLLGTESDLRVELKVAPEKLKKAVATLRR